MRLVEGVGWFGFGFGFGFGCGFGFGFGFRLGGAHQCASSITKRFSMASACRRCMVFCSATLAVSRSGVTRSTLVRERGSLSERRICERRRAGPSAAVAKGAWCGVGGAVWGVRCGGVRGGGCGVWGAVWGGAVLPDDLRGLGSGLIRVHVLRGDPRRVEGVPQVGHEREERHHQNRQPVLQQRGYLVAAALAEARREHDEHVPIVEGSVDRLLLLGAERRGAKHARILLGKLRAPWKVGSAVARVEHVRGLLLRRGR